MNDDRNGKKLRFVQLYTSKSFESRRGELVNPPEQPDSAGIRRTSSTENLQKHVLSPRLVDAIAQTTQVVWANTRKQEGLTGRSDIRLQTAVGMPVAMDTAGNMCIVVMFSPNNIQSSDEAMEYLQSLSRSATSTSIPCLLPVCTSEGDSLLLPLPTPSPGTSLSHSSQLVVPQNALGEGVTARFVSLDDIKNTESHSHDLSQAPKDTFGIPMLPSVAELGGTGNVTPEESIDAFDEASYGIWNTIMDEIFQDPSVGLGNGEHDGSHCAPDPSLQVVLPDQHYITDARKERLEEFLSAFLAMSVFDVADVWVPAANDGYPDCLRHVVSIVAGNIVNNEHLLNFELVSENALIKFWTGGVGRAYSSGNPVWSCNPQVFVDAGRALAFERAGIQTVLAIPVFSAKQTLPTCVVSCYSLVKSNSVPFVLRFVQQALRLLWEGLDQFEPQSSTLTEGFWRTVNPADLGEMAADVEMQQHFVNKKRPYNLITSYDTKPRSVPNTSVAENDDDEQYKALATQFQSVLLPSGEVVRVPFQLTESSLPQGLDSGKGESSCAPITPTPALQVNVQVAQEHLATLRSVQNAVPFLDHVPTTTDGSKRAHIAPPNVIGAGESSTNSSTAPLGPIQSNVTAFMPLPMPRPFPSHVVRASSVSPNGSHHSAFNLASISTTSGNAGQPNVALPLNSLPDEFPRGQNLQSQQQPKPQAHESSAKLSNQFQAVLHHQRGHQPPPPPPDQHIQQQPILMDLANYALLQQQQQQQQQERLIMTQQSELRTPIPAAGIAINPEFPVPSDLFCQSVGSNLTLVASKKCRIIGCDLPSLSRRPYCEEHSGNRICEYDGCSKCAQGCTRFCIAHGGGRRCTFSGCDKGARDKFFCAAHGGGKRCSHGECNKSAVGGSDLCTAHGGGRRCEIDGCDKSAQSSTRFCVKHGGGKKCAQDGCEKVARGRTNYCAAHGGGVRCKLEGCNRVAIGKMQLCRAHGGSSSRARNKRESGEATPSPVFDDGDQQFLSPESLFFNQDVAISSVNSSVP